MIDEKYFEIERWTLSAGDDPAGLTAGIGAVQMLFVAERLGLRIFSDTGEAFPVGRCELAVIPARWRAACASTSESPAEVIRILPKAV